MDFMVFLCLESTSSSEAAHASSEAAHTSSVASSEVTHTATAHTLTCVTVTEY